MKQPDNTTPHKASDYNRNIRDTIPFYDYFLNEAIDLVRTLKPSVKLWLDTGCGTGTLIRKAYPYFPSTRFIIADPSENMLNQARKLLGKIPGSCLQILDPIGTENLLTRAAQIQKLDVITAVQSHHYMMKNTRVIATQTCVELLDKGGVYITFENIRPGSEQGITLGLDRWARYQLSRGKTEQTVNEHRQRFDRAYFPITIDDHLQLLSNCGFTTCELFWYSYMQAGFYAIKE